MNHDLIGRNQEDRPAEKTGDLEVPSINTPDTSRIKNEHIPHRRKGDDLTWVGSTTRALLRWLWQRNWTAIATVAIAVTTFYYTKYARRQWNVMSGQLNQMQKQLPELQKSAQAAADTVDLTRRQLASTQAAIISFQFDLREMGLHVTLSNSGHSIGSQIHGSIDVARERLPTMATIGPPQHFDISIPQLGDRELERTYPLPGWTNATWRTVRDGQTKEQTVRLDVSLSFDNGFGDMIRSSQCLLWFNHSPVVTRTGTISENGWVECHDFPARLKFWAEKEREAQNTPKAN